MPYQIATRRDRITGAGGAALLVALIGYGLVTGLGVDFPRRIADDLKVVALLPDPPPPRPDPVPAPKPAQKRKEGAASPPNLKSKATEVVAPPPPIVLRQPPPIPVAPVAGLGSDRSAGAAPVVGPGTGSGGQGNGLGSGAGGDGDGGGGGGTPPVKTRDPQYRDLPPALLEANAAGRVTMGLTVLADGRAVGCEIEHSSGNRALDVATCAVSERELRFRPARDRSGRKVAEDIIYEQTWTADPGPGSDDR